MSVHPLRPVPAIFEVAEERDRKECISLNSKVDGANRELAQWLVDHPTYPNTAVAQWLACSEFRIRSLRKWASAGFIFDGPRTRDSREESIPGSNRALKTKDNFQDDTFEHNDEEVEDPAHTLKNIIDSIRQEKAVAEAWRKILKVSSFDREAKKQIYVAIDQLIVKWRTVQSTLDRKGTG